MRTLAAILAIVFGLPILAAAQDATVGRPTWATADAWTYRSWEGDEFTMTVISAASDGYAVEFKDSKGKDIVPYTVDVSPPGATFFRFQWPLKVGKKWDWTRSGEDIDHKYGTPMTWTTAEKVEGRESVTVPAGTFDAVRIHGRECKVTQQSTSGAACGNFDVWYAPQVKNYVRVRWTGSYWGGDKTLHPQELISYHVHYRHMPNERWGTVPESAQ